MNKENLIRKILEKLEKEIVELEESASSAHEASVEAPGAMQSHSDTSKFQNKVSEGNIGTMIQQKKIQSEAIKNVALPERASDINLGACVLVEDSGIEKRYIVLPGGSGIEAWDDETLDSYMSITPDTPIGKALLGKKEGEKTSFKIGQKEKKLLIKKIW
jgi:transcription elongation GreA/GreB family factor